eukprot:TRINITY_DN756_c0_g2_i1.p1 TRINITY_DN756_c0_g2~~TRINITY_DN756_c0_g2_i1.p1  ORF type:complete len:946 (+),score=195.85 TRINITY_DN756_c0_g2_i1:30-2840(+)
MEAAATTAAVLTSPSTTTTSTKGNIKKTETTTTTTTSQLLLHHHHHQVLTLGGRMGSYVWVHKGEASYLRGGFLFEAKASNDITVGLSILSDPPNSLDPSYQHVAYEIVLGGWLNIKSALRKFGSEVAYVTKQQRGNEAVIASTTEFCKYWVVMDDGLIIVGKGVGTDVREILRWRDTSPVRIRSFGLTTWNTPIQFRSILFEPLSSFTSEVNLDLLATNTQASSPLMSGADEEGARNSVQSTRTPSRHRAASSSFTSSSSSSFSNLKDGWKDFYYNALESEMFSDAEITFNDSKDSVFAHRVLLFSVPYFRTALMRDETKLRQARSMSQIQLNEMSCVSSLPGTITGEEKKKSIHIPHFVLKTFLQFVYTGELSFRDSTSSDDLSMIFGGTTTEESDLKTCTLHTLAQLTSCTRLLQHLDLFYASQSLTQDPTVTEKNTNNSNNRTTTTTTTTMASQSRDRRPKEHNFKEILRNGYFSDVVFVLKDGKTAAAHRIILASWSDFFKALFTNGMRESSQQEIRLDDVSHAAFSLMLVFMYSGGKDVVLSENKMKKIVNISDTDATELIVELLLLSDQFGIPQLKGHCVRALYNSLTIDNACQLVCFADDMELAQFKDHCLSFIESHFNSISKTDLFLELPSHILLEIVLSDDLIASSEMEVFNALELWIEHNNCGGDSSLPSSTPNDKEIQVEQLLECIRYPLMDRDSLVKLEKECVYIKRSPGLLSLVRSYLGDDLSVSQIQSSPALDEEDFRRKTRTVRCLKELRFVTCGDENGVFHCFGSNFGKSPWVNPHKANRITIRLSGPTSRYSSPEFLVSRSYKTTCHTTGYPPWFSVDLGKYSLIATHYTMCHDGSDNYPRNWSLQGANNQEEWTELMVHKDDDTIYRSGQFVSFKLAYNKQTMTPYRMFRVLMTGPSATGQSNILSCSGFELYGYLI